MSSNAVTTIPFTKAHGALNDFLLTWEHELPSREPGFLSQVAMAICHRNAGVGADGWIVIRPEATHLHGRIRLFNPDGGEVEISGNGTRCAGALLIEAGHAADEVRIMTGAGEKYMRVLERAGRRFLFEMDMGTPVAAPGEVNTSLALSTGEVNATIVNVGNPQCAVFVDDFDFDWRAMGREIERHPRFPKRTNVSFVRVLNHETIDVRFFERGVGETNSSGTGSTGAMASAVLRGLVGSSVLVQTPAGPLKLRWEKTILLEGPAELTAHGEFFLPDLGGFQKSS